MKTKQNHHLPSPTTEGKHYFRKKNNSSQGRRVGNLLLKFFSFLSRTKWKLCLNSCPDFNNYWCKRCCKCNINKSCNPAAKELREKEIFHAGGTVRWAVGRQGQIDDSQLGYAELRCQWNLHRDRVAWALGERSDLATRVWEQSVQKWYLGPPGGKHCGGSPRAHFNKHGLLSPWEKGLGKLQGGERKYG